MGNGWDAGDVVCTSGPQDRPYEEQHDSISIAVVVEGSFQYRSAKGSTVMSPGSLMLGNIGHDYECGHDYAIGDRCLSFHYTPDFFDRADLTIGFPVNHIPPIRTLAPYVVAARLGIRMPERVIFEEFAFELAGRVSELLLERGNAARAPSAADARRISDVVRFIEANPSEDLSLAYL